MLDRLSGDPPDGDGIGSELSGIGLCPLCKLAAPYPVGLIVYDRKLALFLDEAVHDALEQDFFSLAAFKEALRGAQERKSELAAHIIRRHDAPSQLRAEQPEHGGHVHRLGLPLAEVL